MGRSSDEIEGVRGELKTQRARNRSRLFVERCLACEARPVRDVWRGAAFERGPEPELIV